MTDTPPSHEVLIPEATVRRHRFSAIWLIPIVAALIAGYLGIRAYSQHGALITISFRTADGLNAGQTTVKYKSLTLGTVESISLNSDKTGVTARVRMNADTDDLLTDHARFWIEKPRLTSTSISDIVSGTYIQLDPGPGDGAPQKHFAGLENQPNLPADEPGTTYKLNATRLGSISVESPVYYRDINVGKVLGYDIGDGFGPISIDVFIKEPYDHLIKQNTRFWNASGFSVKLGPSGLHVELQSLQSVLGGSIGFETPAEGSKAPQADTKTIFSLYEDRRIAEASTFSKRVPCVTYVQNSIKDLAAGSPVVMFGIEVGEVTEVKLMISPQKDNAKVRVAFEIQPERVLGNDPSADTAQIMHQLVQNGMRVQMESSNLIAGQEVLSLQFVPKTEGVDIAMEGDAMMIPGQGGGTDNLTDALSDVAAKLDRIPFDEIGQHLNHLLATADQTLGGTDMQQAVHSLAATLANAQELTRSAKENLTPALQRLPDISAQMQNAVTQANSLMSSVNHGYGQDSDFQRNAQHVLNEVNDAARSIRLLSDYLERHPEALVQGKTLDKGKP